jgi:hypothetical protein
MNKELFEALKFDGALSGEAWRNRPQKMPYDRPSEYTNVEDALDFVFKNLTDPKRLSSFLALMEAGVPVDQFVETLVLSMFGEGKINATMMALMVPALTVMFIRVAEAAGIDVAVTEDGSEDMVPPIMLMDIKKRGFDTNKLGKADNANRKSQQELKDMPKNMGLMKRPESIT